MEVEKDEFEARFVGPGVNIEKRVSPAVLAQLLAVVFGAPDGPIPIAVAPSQPHVQLSLREYLDEVGAKFKSDQIVAIGQYMSLHEGRATFSREEVKARFAMAKEPMPSNFPRDFSAAVKSGMVAENHQSAGHYYITKTGIRAVEQRFSDGA